MECLDANVVQDMMSGTLPAAAMQAALEHLDDCEECRLVVATVAREATDVPPDGAPNPVSLNETAPAGERDLKPAGMGVPIGRTFGRFTIIERLGAGAMGVVYRARDTELGRDVALKQLRRPDPAFTERLVREARSMAQVNHPNVVAVYDVGVTDDDITYIAMELVEGTSLLAWQQQRTVAEIVQAYIAAGRGLAAAHATGIVHRDFKPDNVLVGRDHRVRVMDFGLAATHAPPRSAVASSTPAVDLTVSGSVLGTPAYMAPEQFQGGHVDARTDEFNFCVALYEALYGQRPFEGGDFDQLAEAVTSGRIRPPPPGARVSRSLRAIVVRGLSVRPGDRFPTMDELLGELGRDRARPWRRVTYVFAALAVLLAVGFAASWVVRDRVTDEIRSSFDATAAQARRTITLYRDQFDVMSNFVDVFPVMTEVAARHDEADFGLGAPEADARTLEELHAKLASTTWDLARRVGVRTADTVIAVADYKGRLLYTSAAPTRWGADITRLPWIASAISAGGGSSMNIVRYDDRVLAATGIVGDRPPAGLAIVFTRTVAVAGEPRVHFLQVIDAESLLDQIRIDPLTRLSIRGLDGTEVGDAQPTLEGNATRTVAIEDYAATRVTGTLVMTHARDPMLELFPGSRTLFALGTLAALAVALLTGIRARSVAARS